MKKSTDDSTLLIHDYYDRRYYWDLEKYFTKEESYTRNGSAVMGVFKEKTNIDKKTFEKDFEKFSKKPN